MKKIIWILAIAAMACKPTPTPIQYGAEICTFCKMTIVDKRYAAQLVTEKGKNYKFDSIECMADFLGENNNLKTSFLLVSDFNQPGSLIDANSASFLVSENLPSPMGGNLNAFESKEKAKIFKEQFEGELTTWAQILKK